MGKNCTAREQVFFALCYSLLMELSQDLHQHPTVHGGGISRGGVMAVAVDVNYM